jgi:hypothetical protein
MGCAQSQATDQQLELIIGIIKEQNMAPDADKAVNIFKKLLALEEDFLDHTDRVSE